MTGGTSINDRLDGYLLVALSLAVYAVTADWGEPHYNDARGAALGAWALATQGSVFVPTSWGPTTDFWLVPAVDGLLAPNRFPGLFALAAPFYLLGLLLGAVPGSSSVTSPAEIPLWPATLTAVAMAAATVGVSHVIFRDLTTRRVAVVATLATAFGTALWTFGATALWPHAATGLLLMLIVRQLQRGRWEIAGLLCAALPLLRPHLAVVPLILGFAVMQRDGLVGALRFWSPTAAGVLLLAAYSQTVFGTWLPAAGYDAASHVGITDRGPAWFVEQLLAGTIGLRRGALVHSTFVLFAVPFVISGWRHAPRWTRWAAGSGLVYLILQVALTGSEGGEVFWGYRVQIEAVLLSLPLLVATLGARAPRERLLTMIASAAVAASIVLHATAVLR